MKPNFIFLACCLFYFNPAKAQTTDTIFYSFIKGGTKAGTQKMWMNGAHEYHFFYQFNDRGRGDSVVSKTTVNDHYLIINSETVGVDYFKKSYHESFGVKKDSATAIVNDDIKTLPFKNEIFVSYEVPGSVEPVIKYLLAQKNMSAKVFKGGAVSIVPLHEKTVSVSGKSIHLYLCEMYFNTNNPPVFVWLDDNKHFFASVSDWFNIIRSGYETLSDTLNTLQELQSKDYYGKQMKALADTLPQQFAVTHVQLYDAEHALMMNDMTVLVKNGEVMKINKTSSAEIPQGFHVIDGTNKTLMPGLWDMHSHYQKTDGLNYLAGGVTHVRDMGNSNNLTLVRDEIVNNELLGPDISYMSGFIDQAGPFQGPTGGIIHNLDEGIKAIDDYAKRGYQQIKLYSSIDPKWVAPLAREAHRLGLRICGHIPSFMTAEQAIQDGYDEITHMNMVMLNFMGDTIDTRAMRRFKVVGERAKNIDINSDEVNALIKLMQQKNISIDPTMHVFSGMFIVYPGDTDAAIKPVVAWMPEDERQNITVQSSMAPVEEKITYVASFNNMMQLLKKLYDNNILIVSGTDGGDAFALENELELYVQAGIPPLHALKCATYNAAKDCNLLNKYGTVKEGLPADMILIDGDPAAKHQRYS